MITQLPDKQMAELDAMVKDPVVRTVIIKMMDVVLLGFLALTKGQMRLFIKFLIETVDALEAVTKNPQRYINELLK